MSNLDSIPFEWGPLVLSFEVACVTTVLLLLIATPLAYLLAYSNFRGRALVEALFATPLVLPPTVLGFFILVVIGNRSPIGNLYTDIFGGSLAFSFEGVVLASLLYSFPFALQPIQKGFESVQPNLIEASRTLGVGAAGTFWRVIAPAGKAGLVTGAMLAFAHTIGEFGVVLMVGGAIPGETRLASIAIYEHVETLEYGAAAAMSLVMLLISFVILSVVYFYGRKSGGGVRWSF